MAEEIHAVVRTDKMYGTDNRAGLVSVKYMGDDGETVTDIDNGNVLKLGALMDDEREIYIGETPSADDDLGDIVLIATPELMYDERKRNIHQFYNSAKSNRPARGYILHHKDIFSVTAEALEGTPEKGAKVTLANGTKLEVNGSGTEVGTIIDDGSKEQTGQYTYFAIQVD